MTREEHKTKMDEMIKENHRIVTMLCDQNDRLMKLKVRDYTPADVEEAYQRGLNDAWMYARKIALNVVYDVSDKALRDAFDVAICYDIFIKYSVQEAIKKIDEYEKQMDVIKIGDELEQITNSGNSTGISCIVTNIGDDKFNGITKDGKAVVCTSMVDRWWRKTGRTFPQIAEVLKAMQEGTES